MPNNRNELYAKCAESNPQLAKLSENFVDLNPDCAPWVEVHNKMTADKLTDNLTALSQPRENSIVNTRQSTSNPPHNL